MNQPSPLRNIKRPRSTTSTTSTPTRTLEARILSQETLHRVDATQLPHGAGVSLGHCRTDMGLCMGHAECADKHCLRRPCSYALKNMEYSDYHGPHIPVDPALRSKVWRWYITTVLVCLLAVAVWTWQ